jgi:ribonuclease HI
VNPLVETTCPNTSKGRYPWIGFRESRRVAGDEIFVFTDGSSKGGYGAVLVQAGVEPVVLTGWTAPTSTRNVGAELNGALLGLKAVRADAEVVLVCDYLGIAAWWAGHWKIKDAEVKERIEQIRNVIRDQWLVVKYVHHRGHQKLTEGDDFTKYNTMADEASTRANDGRG